ncbi:MAG: prepilin-type N-terminal cleavage/methylation domain-containing protein [Desulfomonilaceae bacterium]
MKKRVPEGFTVTEMMVAMAVMAVILLIAIAFFRVQSQMSGTATRDRLGRQDITLALTALERDIVQAGYGVALYPQLAFMFGDNLNVNATHANQNPTDTARYKLPVFGTIWINYGQYIKSTIPTIPGTLPAQQYSMWPSLVYNLQPLSNSDMAGGTFSIPAADNAQNYLGPNDPRNNVPEATANANNISAVIV